MPGLIPGKALGLIETVGLVGAIEACDAAAKAADVIVSAAEVTDGALVTIKIFGELGAVQAAVESGSNAAARVGQLLASHIIPNPDENLGAIMGDAFRPGTSPKPPKHGRIRMKSSPVSRQKTGHADVQDEIGDLENMKVSELRNYARTIPNLAIKGREISRADKETLIREIRRAKGKW